MWSSMEHVSGHSGESQRVLLLLLLLLLLPKMLSAGGKPCGPDIPMHWQSVPRGVETAESLDARTCN